MSVLNGLLANYGDDIARKFVDHADDAVLAGIRNYSDDAVRAATNQTDDLAKMAMPQLAKKTNPSIPVISQDAQKILDMHSSQWVPDTEGSLMGNIYDVVGDDVDKADNIFNEIIDYYKLRPVSMADDDDYFLVPKDREYVGSDGANRLFDDAADYFSPSVDISQSWGAGAVPSRYIPFFDEQIRIANHNNSYIHPYGLVFDNESLYKGEVPIEKVKNDILAEMRRAIDDGVATSWLDDATSSKYGITIEEAVEEMSDNFTDDFMKYENGDLSVMGEKPLRITPKTTSEDVTDYLYDSLRNKSFALAGILGGGAILGNLLNNNQNQPGVV